MQAIETQDLLRAADACERAATAADVQAERRAVLDVIAEQHVIQVGLMRAQMQSLSQVPRPQERLPLRADGDDFGYVESRIPKHIFFHLLQQKNFGYAGLCDDAEMKSFLKANPTFAVKTISGKTTVGWRAGKSAERGTRSAERASGRRGCTFGRGTLVLAT